MASENIPLDLTQFVIKKAIDGKRSSKKAEPLKSGSIFIEVNLKHQSQNHFEDQDVNEFLTSENLATQIFDLHKNCHSI